MTLRADVHGTRANPLFNGFLSLAVGTAILAACGPAALYGGGRMVSGEAVQSSALGGNLLGDPARRYVSVYLPGSYDSGQKRYPVLYVLQSFRGAAVNVAAVSQTLDDAIRAGRAREMILVFVDGFNALGGSWYLSSPTIGDWDTFITRELVAHIDSAYRTLDNRGARAISGCSMGGYGALHLAFTHPDVFGLAAGNSTSFSMWSDAGWEQGRSEFAQVPGDARAVTDMPLIAAAYVGAAAAAAPNPSAPPLYLDMPFRFVNERAEIAPEVKAKFDAFSPESDVRRYQAQAVRLRGLMIYHGLYDGIQYARAFDRFLAASGVPHQYLEVPAVHCALDWTPVLEFVSDHVVE